MDKGLTSLNHNRAHLDKDGILAILIKHKLELKAAGLLHLRLFGSVARGENDAASDVDLLFDCDESECVRAYGFQDRVTEILGTKTHLSSAKYIKPKIRERILQRQFMSFRDPPSSMEDILACIATC